ncbi:MULTISPECIES: MarR family transcriptional regulator [Priestia]|uniref:MarR family transcriptional regulator n=1 Tax=Priestia TaxID=2800373 RepID=UPI000BF5CD63|nr:MULTISPECIES: MarR family transcriptional regulator [Priestia]MBK0010656.1 MarR family transcriptional regulator [Bacillus sp. S35]MDC0706756.1 MarR family transcriptional regulator [Priestia sp. AB]PFQ76276.1 MarR family transcriptional regulator [Priestia megaterium]PNE04471.1 MarR family transcriptional regulator [Priestia megaterium]
MKKALEEAEKKARLRDSNIEEIIGQVAVGLSADQQKLLLEVLHNTTGENYFIGKRKKKTDGVKFVQIIMDNYNYLCKINYLSSAEKAFLMDLTPYLEFKTNIIVERSDDEEEVDADSASPSYLAKVFNKNRGNISSLMNGLLAKGILAVAESGMTTDDGRVCTSRTWFVNPNIMCCSPKDGVDKATQKIFKRSLKNFKVEGSSKKHQLPIYLF